jgi:hypothetical protein
VAQSVLSAAEVDRFVRDGAVLVSGAFPRETAEQCRELLWAATGCDEHDRSTWTKPMIRITGRGDPPFAAAANTARLHTAFDQLAGAGRWVRRSGMGTFPIRFPVETPPDDDGWHIESTGTDNAGTMIVDPRSRERLLLMLFLFSDVGPDDAPTRLRLGSHLVAARRLFTQDAPVDFFRTARELARRTSDLPEAAATGDAGDVWLCHPFLVHAAQRNRGSRVKFMAQPPLSGTEPIDPSRPAESRSPVEEAVRRALSR